MLTTDNIVAVAPNTVDLARFIASSYPFEVLPDGTIRKIGKNEPNRPRQSPTCDELGNPLPNAETSYMEKYTIPEVEPSHESRDVAVSLHLTPWVWRSDSPELHFESLRSVIGF